MHVFEIMKKLLVIFLGIFLLSVTPIFGSNYQPPFAEWEKTYGGDGFDLLYCVEEVEDGYVAAGSMEKDNAYYTWIMKVDENGNKEWEKFYFVDPYEWNLPTFLDKTGDGFILAGETYQYTYIAKLDREGNIEWYKTYGRYGYDGIFRIWCIKDDGEEYIACGYRYDYQKDIYIGILFKLDSNGNIKWIKSYENVAESTFPHSIVIETDGYSIAGSIANKVDGKDNYDLWLFKTDKNGNTIWQKTYDVTMLDEHWSRYHFKVEDGYVLCGVIDEPYGAGDRDIWIVKTDLNGNMIWNETYGESNTDMTWSFERASDGYVLCFAENYGGWGGSKADIWVIKIDENGNMQWKIVFGGNSEDRAYCIKRTRDNGYIIAGRTESFGSSSDGYLIKISPDKEMETPEIEVKKPREGFIYLWNFGIPFPFINKAIVLGNLEVEVVANDESGISKVEFFVNNQRVAVDDEEPYTYKFEAEKGIYELKVRVINNYGGSAKEVITIKKFL